MLSANLSRQNAEFRHSIDSQLGWSLLTSASGKKRYRKEEMNEEERQQLYRMRRLSQATRPKRESGSRVRVNVSGRIFDTYHTTLSCKKGSIFALDNVWNYFEPTKKEFFFERDARAFEAIFIYMQCGLISKPEKVPYKVFIEDLQFFGFGDIAFKYYNEEIQLLREATYVGADVKGFRSQLWHMIEYPNATRSSRVLSFCSTVIVFISITLLCIESVPHFKRTSNKRNIQTVEMFCVIWFTLETLLKFLVSYKKVSFFRSTTNLLDITSVLPFYICKLTTGEDMFKASLLRVFRLARGFGSVGLVKCARVLHIIMVSMQSCIKETLVLISIFAITAVLFSTLLYYMEHDPTNPTDTFDSIPGIMWFGFVSMTTVGYGDMIPITIGTSSLLRFRFFPVLPVDLI